MKQGDYEIARKLKNRLSEVINILDFKIFGSRARGDAGEFSDMDVFVEVESLDKELKNLFSAPFSFLCEPSPENFKF